MPFNCTPQNDDGGPRGRLGCLSIFSHPGWDMPPKNDIRTLEDEELHIAHTYVLLNCEDIRLFANQFIFFHFLKFFCLKN